ncbi:hypothetical protein AGOR_G00152180 [Albula goreensis]|uniref:Uncharacterized protein n=1 Tax=Albula goreensis TaxID=1534307 RepID=A0A8T3D1R0_9TELE|nr:hypothetical protein AGOR_G00152180 [Albula goreensis]
MNKSQRELSSRTLSVVEVKSKFGAEFRRFSVERAKPGRFEEFYCLLQHVHRIPNVELLVGYADAYGDLLPINNDDNYHKAVSTASPLLRLFLQRRGEAEEDSTFDSPLRKQKRKVGHRRRPAVRISQPRDFRPVSSIIDVDVLPESLRRVRLHRSGPERPLGFYIRDGASVRLTPRGPRKVPGIFISRLVPGGLAHGTGLLAVDDEVLEVNGIEVAGKSLDQVTDMMVANSHNLVVTVKPANQQHTGWVSSARRPGYSAPTHSTPSSYIIQNFLSEDQDSDWGSGSGSGEGEGEDEDDEDLVLDLGEEVTSTLPSYKSHLGLRHDHSTDSLSTLGNEWEGEGTVITL